MTRRSRKRMRNPRTAGIENQAQENSNAALADSVLRRGHSRSYKRMKGEDRRRIEAKDIVLPLAFIVGMSLIAALIFLASLDPVG